MSPGLAETGDALDRLQRTRVVHYQVCPVFSQIVSEILNTLNEELGPVRPSLGEVEVPRPLEVRGVEAVERDDAVADPLGGHQRLVVMEPQVIPEQADHSP